MNVTFVTFCSASEVLKTSGLKNNVFKHFILMTLMLLLLDPKEKKIFEAKTKLGKI